MKLGCAVQGINLQEKIIRKQVLNDIKYSSKNMGIYAICPRSLDPFYEVNDHMKWVNTSWTYSVHILKF